MQFDVFYSYCYPYCNCFAVVAGVAMTVITAADVVVVHHEYVSIATYSIVVVVPVVCENE